MSKRNYYWATELISLSTHMLAQAPICYPLIGHISSLKKLDFGGRLWSEGAERGNNIEGTKSH